MAVRAIPVLKVIRIREIIIPPQVAHSVLADIPHARTMLSVPLQSPRRVVSVRRASARL